MCPCRPPATWRRSCCRRRTASPPRSAACWAGRRLPSLPRQRPHAESGMTDIVMPKLSDTMEEGKIIRWLKQRGDRVAIGDVLAEVETDNANIELEAFDEGVLAEIRTAEGEAAPVGAVIAVLGEAGEATDGESAPAHDAEPAPAERKDGA